MLDLFKRTSLKPWTKSSSPHEITWNANLMQQVNFIGVFLAKNTPIKLPSCIKLMFHIISWGRCTVKQPSSCPLFFSTWKWDKIQPHKRSSFFLSAQVAERCQKFHSYWETSLLIHVKSGVHCNGNCQTLNFARCTRISRLWRPEFPQNFGPTLEKHPRPRWES